MFNDLNNANRTGGSAVDDIFAETDRPNAAGVPSDIETHNVGLANSGESLAPLVAPAPSGSKSYVKLIIIAVIVLALLGAAYFVYSQYFKSNANETPAGVTPETNSATTNSTTNGSETPTTNNNFVSEIPGVTPETPTGAGEFATSTEPSDSSFLATTSPVEVLPESTIDSDSDGLTDSEERANGTNINVIDTDNDGLSDYEEVKIYRTNPLNADTDTDGYMDGAEVKSGYNPNGAGKLPGNLP